MTPIFSTSAAASFLRWTGWALELLWLMALILVPIAYLDRTYVVSEAVNAYFDVPKTALLRILVGLMGIIWLVELSIKPWTERTDEGPPPPSAASPNQVPSQIIRWLRDTPARLWQWLRSEPAHWVVLAVWFYLGSTLLSTVLSGAFSASLWGEIPGQDSYPAYTIAVYVLLFGVIATHLKTPRQLWWLLGAAAISGVLVAGYGIFQHFQIDFLSVTEDSGGGFLRVTSFMGNTLFAGAFLMMVIPITLLAGAILLPDPHAPGESWPRKLRQWGLSMGVAGLFIGALIVELLGLSYTFSRGPWVGTMVAIVGFLLPAAIFSGWQIFGRVAILLGISVAFTLALIQLYIPASGVTLWLAAFFALAASLGVVAAIGWSIVGRLAMVFGLVALVVGSVLLIPSWFQEETKDSQEQTGSNTSAVAERFGTIGESVLSGGISGRGEMWVGSWRLIRDRPWFGFSDLSAPWLRSIVGYGPDLFRYVYLLESPPRGRHSLPFEPDNAHNYLINHAVEQGILGIAAFLAIFVSVLIAGGYRLIKQRKINSAVHHLILVALIATLGGRFVEMMAGVPRISDLMLFWVLLAIFVALPRVMRGPPDQPKRPSTAPQPRNRRRSGRAETARSSNRQYFLRLAISAFTIWLIIGIGVLTWTKGINYVRAAISAGDAVQEFRQGDLQGSLASLDRAIELAPDVSPYYNYRAQVFFTYSVKPDLGTEAGCASNEDLPYSVCLGVQAFESNLRGVVARPYYYRSRLALANSAFNLKLNDEAASFYSQVVDLTPGTPGLYLELAEAYLEAGEPEKALESTEKLRNLRKDFPLSANLLLIEGLAYRDLDQPQRSVEVLELSLAKDRLAASHARRAYEMLDTLYAQLGRERTIQDFSDAIRQNPQDAGAYFRRGREYSTRGEVDRGIADFAKAIELDPEHILAYTRRGDEYRQTGQYQLAVQDFGRAIALGTNDSLTFYRRGISYNELGEYERAIADLDHALGLDPQMADAYRARGLAYLVLDQLSKAKSDLDLAERLNPDLADAYSEGLAYFGLEQYQPAVDSFTEAINLDPDAANPLRFRAMAYGKLGEYQAALNDYNKFMDIGQPTAQVFAARGEAYYELGESAQSGWSFSWNPDCHFSQRLSGSFSEATPGTYRFLVPGTSISDRSDFMSVTVASRRDKHDLSLANMFIGHNAESGNPWDFDGHQVRVTWDGGSPGFGIPPNTSKTSDTFEFKLEPGKGIIIAWDTRISTQGFSSASNVPGTQGYYMSGSQTAGEKSPVGLSPLKPGLLLGVKYLTFAPSFSDEKPVALTLEAARDHAQISHLYTRAQQDFAEANQLDSKNALALAGLESSHERLCAYQMGTPDLYEAVANQDRLYNLLGQPDRSAKATALLTGIDPGKHAGIRLRQGMDHYEMGQYQEAINDLTEVIRLEPRNGGAYNTRALSYVALEQYRRGIEDLDKAIGLSPQMPEGYQNRGLAYLRLDQKERAIQDLDQAINLDPQMADAYRLRGEVYASLGQPERALVDFAAAIRIDPLDSLAYSQRGRDYAKLGQSQKALDDYNNAIQINPLEALAYSNRGRYYVEAGRPQQALADLDKAIQLDPGLTDAYQSRGLVHLILGQNQRAIQDLAHVIGLNQNIPETFWNRGLAYLREGRHQKSLDDFDQAILLDPGPASVYHDRALAYMSLNQYEMAIHDLDQAIRLDPGIANAYQNRGLAYARLEKYGLAIQEFSEALRLDATLQEAYHERGQAYLNLGRYEEAVPDLGKTIDFQPQLANVYLQRGLAYLRLGESENAISDYNQAIRLNPKDGMAYVGRGHAHRQLAKSLQSARQSPDLGDCLFQQALLGSYAEAGVAAYRFVLPPTAGRAGPTEVSVTFQSRTEKYGVALWNVFIGQRAEEGNPWDFDGGQVRVTWDGGNFGFRIPFDGSATSDPVSLTINPGREIIVSYDTADYTQGFRSATSVPGVQGYFQMGDQSAGDDAPAGLLPREEGLLLGLSYLTLNPVAGDGGQVTGTSGPENNLNRGQIIQLYKQAIQDYKKAINLDLDDPAVATGLGSSATELCRYQQSTRQSLEQPSREPIAP